VRPVGRWIEPKNAAAWQGFERILQHCDVSIAVELLGQASNATEGGSYAKAVTLDLIRQDILEADAAAIAATLHADILRPWARFNYGDPDLAPVPVWDATPPEDTAKLATTWQTAGNALSAIQSAAAAQGMTVDLDAFAARFGIPLVRRAAPPPPTTIAPVGTKVLTANEIANSVTEVGSPAWQTLVRDGTIKFVDTGLIMTGYSTRPIVFAYYKRPVGDGMTWCTRPVYKDDGSAVGASTYTGFGCNTEEISWERGTDSGVIRHYPNGNRCWQLGWNQSTLSFDETLVTCP
jgi:hypothetical protein